MTQGFTVQIDALRGYGDNLDDFRSQADTFSELTGKADVSDEAWGVVGLATRGSYTEALAELKDLLSRMKDGLAVTAEKIRKVADLYEGNDKEGALHLGKHAGEIDKVAEAGPACG